VGSARLGRSSPDGEAAERNQAVVRRFYDEVCNQWKLDLADELVAEDLRFRAALGSSVVGREAFKRYLEGIRAVFPDLQHRIDELLASGDRVAIRLTYSATHLGRLGDVEATGARVEFVGAGFFRVLDGRILEGWVVGDTQAV
jgi:steroid delta-isomerase-like uncharacterized protein